MAKKHSNSKKQKTKTSIKTNNKDSNKKTKQATKLASINSTNNVSKKIDLKNLKYNTTKDINIPTLMIDQVVGQEDAVNVIKKAAQQRRHVLLIGEPGTGKSMLGMALAELLPKEKLVDVLALPNANDEHQPLIRTITAGKGRELATRAKIESNNSLRIASFTSWIIIMIVIALFMVAKNYFKWSDVVFAALFIGGMIMMAGVLFALNVGKRMGGSQNSGNPKVIVDNFDKSHVAFYDATGAHAGALLGDVLHDPFQSGGLGTPANERVVAGMIHKAHMGVLFVDEISTLEAATQQDLLTALQEGKYPITGQSERSAGAMVRTEPVPCQFILVAAGNVDTVQHMHPALRSRIRGYGYEVHMNETMLDTTENRNKIVVFIAQEVNKDKKIPHFDKDAINYIIEEARRRANRKGHLSLMFRDLGGLIRAAGDVAIESKAELVSKEHITRAKKIARSLEQQMSDKYIERKKEYEVIVVSGKKIGRVNGLAVIGSGVNYSGMVLPIEAEVTPGGKESEIIATGKLGEIAKEAVKNVSAIIKKHFGEDIKETKDVYVQFLQTYEGVEGDSASIAVAITIISALKKVPIKQDYAMTGSLSVRGEVLPIGGVSAKIEAAIAAGIKNIIVPKSNVQDIVVDKEQLAKVRIIAVENITEVLREVIDWHGKEDVLKKIEHRGNE